MDCSSRKKHSNPYPLLWLAVFCLAILAGCVPTGELMSSDVEGVLTPDSPLASSAANIPSPTRTPIQAISGGKEIVVPSFKCMDLDSGALLELDDVECDFALELPETADQSGIRFIPLSYASFAFNQVYWELPDAQTCSLQNDYSPKTQRINATGGYYVCYQTGQGHWGILNIKALTNDGLQVYWITYPDSGEVIAKEPVYFLASPTSTPIVMSSQTSTPEKVFSQGTSMWVGVDYGVDLDLGGIQMAWNGSDDLVVSAGKIGEDGLLLGLQIEPTEKAVIQSGTGFTDMPSLKDCRDGVDYQSEPLLIEGDHIYRCFQTDEGRLGYIYIHESSPGIGIRLDWKTWPDILDSYAEPSATSTPIASNTVVQVVVPPQLGGVKVYHPGYTISFTWQLKNIGTTTWNTRYSLVFAGGTSMGGLEKKYIPYPIANGMVVRLALSLTIPQEPGTYVAQYWLVDDAGHRFGMGENGSHPLTLVINSGTPGITLADGRGITLSPGTCYDLDLGYPSVDDKACDFWVNRSQDPELIQIESSQASFDFGMLFSNEPRLGQCRTVNLSSGRRVIDLEDWYVCYQTNEGRNGWLKIIQHSPDGLVFDWKTFQ